MKGKSNLADRVIIALHRVIRAVDLYSRTLLERHGLTGSQLLVSLQRIAAMMDAEGIDASPVLYSGSLRASARRKQATQ